MNTFSLNPFAISGLLIVLTYFPLFLFIIIKGKSKIAKIFSLHIFSTFIWGIGSFLIGINTNPDIANHILKFAYAGVIFIPVFFFHTVLLMTRKQAKFIIFLTYLQASCFLVLMFAGQMMHSTKYIFNSFYWNTKTFSYSLSFGLWLIIISSAHLQLISYYKRCYPEQRKQILALMLAIIGFIGGILNFLPGLGIDLYPFGNFLIPIHSLVVTYAILKHQLLDIKIVIRKGVIYTILLLLISLFYLTLVLLSEKAIQGVLGYQSTFFSIISAFLIGVLFFPLRNKIQQIVDRAIFQKTQEETIRENILLRREIAQSEKMKAVATLASGMAHEIKNPLTPIKVFTENLPKRSNDRQFLQDFSRIVGPEVDRIDTLVNQLLDFAKPAPLKFERTAIDKLICDTLDFLNSHFIQHKIHVIRKFDSGQKIYLNIDPNQLKQALLNIFLNAIKAMPDGGTLTVCARPPSSLSQDAFICVHDTGIGISKKDLPQIFDPFFSRKDTGTGLGLAVTHGIITEHGGTIKVKSKVGEGTEFIITLPSKPESVSQIFPASNNSTIA